MHAHEGFWLQLAVLCFTPTFVFPREDISEGETEDFTAPWELDVVPLPLSAHRLQSYRQISTRSWGIIQNQQCSLPQKQNQQLLEYR